ncbi:MAG TPA: hypothetical protein PKC24_07925, partial [Cyclobacteriaceae bacterium]|nr:hypothetical protein [Cyclobacteriaceae bacterium]
VRENLKYLRYLALPVLLILALSAWNSAIFKEAPARIVQFNREFVPEAPFSFYLENESLQVFRNEDFELLLKIDGLYVPERVNIQSGRRVLRMENLGNGNFKYTFSKVQEAFSFNFEAAGFNSVKYTVALIERPELLGLSAELNFPAYLNRRPEKLSNVGNFIIPEGTEVKWSLNASNAQEANIAFAYPDELLGMNKSSSNTFTAAKIFKESRAYSMLLRNNQAQNKEAIAYQVEVIKDQYPQINARILKDSLAFRYMLLGGEVSDDYGLSDLRLHFELKRENNDKVVAQKIVRIPLNINQLQQSYSLFWPLDSLKLSTGDRLNFYLEVWDNDGVNGRKSTKTGIYQLNMPSAEEVKAAISQSKTQTEQSINRGVEKSSEIRQQIEDSRRDLKGKQNLNWEDKKMVEELIQQQQELSKMIQDMQEKNKALEQKKQSLTELDEKLREKAEQLQKLMDELLDDETKKLLQELEKLLEQNADPAQLQRQLENMLRNQNVLQKNLERAKELFKRLQFEYEVNEAARELQQQIERQEELSEKTGDQNNTDSKGNNEDKQGNKGEENKGGEQQTGNEQNKSEDAQNQDVGEQQEQLAEDFKAWEEKINELEERKQDIRSNMKLPDEEQMKNVEQMMEQIQQELKQNNQNRARQMQQKTIQEMQKMQQQMSQQQSGMQMEMDMQNLESMRHILHDLVKLSFDQEDLFNEFVQVNQSDPRFVTLSQQQLKLQDDFKVISDSLQELSKRMFMLDAFLPREIEAVNANLDKSMYELRERRKANAVQAMRFTMTSMNNLALLFDDMMQAMMEAMANAMPSMQNMKSKGNPQNISELQRQLNERIQDMKENGRDGRAQSEELARMAEEQERIRRAFQEMQEKLQREGIETPGSDLPGKMEQTELDLVNKQITEMTIRRQQEILTRMLESEKAMREKEMDDERKAETANPYEKQLPKAFEEYLRLKEKELELLKTVPPKLYPYYKREAGEYFKRMGNE